MVTGLIMLVKTARNKLSSTRLNPRRKEGDWPTLNPFVPEDGNTSIGESHQSMVMYDRRFGKWGRRFYFPKRSWGIGVCLFSSPCSGYDILDGASWSLSVVSPGVEMRKWPRKINLTISTPTCEYLYGQCIDDLLPSDGILQVLHWPLRGSNN